MVQSQLELPTSIGATLQNCTVWQFMLWCCRQRRRWQVQGRSMLPTLHPGDQVLVNFLAYQHTLPKVGDIVIAQHPHQCELHLIKRVMSTADEQYFLQGDNTSESIDSRNFRAIPVDLIIGKVISLF